jgi:hypothetical protein
MIVLFEEGDAVLLLSGVERDTEGNIKFADVVNGNWRLEIRDGEGLAKSGNFIVTRWRLPEYEEMEIPSGMKGGYNEIMQWARERYSSGL